MRCAIKTLSPGENYKVFVEYENGESRQMDFIQPSVIVEWQS